jgi:hypothetical protein
VDFGAALAACGIPISANETNASAKTDERTTAKSNRRIRSSCRLGSPSVTSQVYLEHNEPTRNSNH